jgi:hypothetical protein
MPHQQKRIYSSHYEWLSLIYNTADVYAILKAIKEVESRHIHIADIHRGLSKDVTFEVIE